MKNETNELKASVNELNYENLQLKESLAKLEAKNEKLEHGFEELEVKHTKVEEKLMDVFKKLEDVLEGQIERWKCPLEKEVPFLRNPPHYHVCVYQS